MVNFSGKIASKYIEVYVLERYALGNDNDNVILQILKGNLYFMGHTRKI